MSGRVFFDTNIFIYLWSREAPAKSSICESLVGAALERRVGVISYQVPQEFFSVVFKKIRPGMSSKVAEEIAVSLFAWLTSVPSSMQLLLEAIRLRDRHRISWYDSLIVAAAIEADCDVLYSEDFQHGRQFGKLRVVNPFFSHKN